jgi:dCMP deaminase
VINFIIQVTNLSTQNKLDLMYMSIAEEIANTLSQDLKRKVAAIAVKNGSILGYGINGTPSGWYSNSIPVDTNGHTIHEHVVHAEVNLIAKMAKAGLATNGATIYVNHAPCTECAKVIRQAGFKNLIYKHDYKSEDGIQVLTRGLHSQVQVSKIGV